MKRSLARYVCALSLTAVVPVTACSAQGGKDPLASQLLSRSFTTRWAAFNQLVRRDGASFCSPRTSRQVSEALIAALENENALLFGPHKIPPDFSDYNEDFFPALIGCVAGLGTTKAIPALVGAMDTGGGATNALVAFGEASVAPIIAVL